MKRIILIAGVVIALLTSGCNNNLPAAQKATESPKTATAQAAKEAQKPEVKQEAKIEKKEAKQQYASDNGGTTVVIHYHRYDNDYSDWDVWNWIEGEPGKAERFSTKDEFGKIAVVNIDKKSDKVGFILKRGDWSEKDVGSDRFVEGIAGLKEVWVIQGDKNIYFDKKDADVTPKVLSAKIDGAKEIRALFSEKAADADISVKDETGKDIAIDKIKKSGNAYTILTKNAMDIGKKYTVEAKGFKGIGCTLGSVLNSTEFLYSGNDLGNTYAPQATVFKVWSPVAQKIDILIFNDSKDKEPQVFPMDRGEKGVWGAKVEKDLKNKLYTYKVNIDGGITETVDPYARALNTNGKKGIIVDLKETNPEGWDNDKAPVLNKFSNTSNPEDYILWEIHVRDFSISPNSGMKNKGKYLAFTEENTTTPSNSAIKTGVAHLKELGVNGIHLNPVYDFASVNEAKDKDYNWGYDPYQFNVPEGSYSTNPDDATRVKEFKSMVQGLHKEGMRVIMDVVYNHTFSTGDSVFDKLVPKYYYRTDENGNYTNGSGCGNEVASEKPMARKFIIDSLKYWATEYHIDGFRFDLMGLIDIDTVKEVLAELRKINPEVLVYGEPWTGGGSSLDGAKQVTKGSQKGLGFAVFNDNLREAIKGDNDGAGLAFAFGRSNYEDRIRNGVVGSINYDKRIGDFTVDPEETINYVSAHDNLTMWDKIQGAIKKGNETEKQKYDMFSQAIVMTSQGIPFILAGEEILRSKNGNHNSYNSGDKDNMIRWENKEKNLNIFNYYKGLIELRSKHKAFRMTTADEIKKNIKFFASKDLQIGEAKVKNVVGYTINAKAAGDEWQEIIVFYNGNKEAANVKLPAEAAANEWTIVVDDKQAGVVAVKEATNDKVVNGKFKGDTFVIPGSCAVVMYR